MVRKFKKVDYEAALQQTVPFRSLAGGLHPDHDTIASFRKVFLSEIKALFVQVLLVAQESGAYSLPRAATG